MGRRQRVGRLWSTHPSDGRDGGGDGSGWACQWGAGRARKRVAPRSDPRPRQPHESRFRQLQSPALPSTIVRTFTSTVFLAVDVPLARTLGDERQRPAEVCQSSTWDYFPSTTDLRWLLDANLFDGPRWEAMAPSMENLRDRCGHPELTTRVSERSRGSYFFCQYISRQRKLHKYCWQAYVVVASSGSAPPESTSIGRAPGCRLYALVRVRPSAVSRGYRSASEENLSRQALC